ncbi:MAG: hypothetical protein IKW78_00425, partial [Prevotella sp.]|nr:hypothetical protein [Prevotella sp.]
PLYQYYADTRRLLRKAGDKCCGYHFSDEDFYVFMTAHEWKHYSGSGTGINNGGSGGDDGPGYGGGSGGPVYAPEFRDIWED